MNRLTGPTSVVLVTTLLLGCSRPIQPPTGAAATPQVATAVAPDAPVAPNTVVVTHWAGGHLMPDHLLPRFARAFNAANHTIAAGKRIEIRPVLAASEKQLEVLTASVPRGSITEPTLGQPTIVTPVVDHWLTELNERVGRTVVDLSRTDELAIAWTGMATYREMAECLGWPDKQIGYADVLALNSDPRGWAACPKAKVAWGQRPLMSYTDPSTSSTGRSVLFGLYAAAAGKPTDQLTDADVADPEVVAYVKRFQRGVDHYVPTTLVLLTKMTLGYSHIYWIAEDVLVQLKKGKAPVTAPAGTTIHPLAGQDMVFIYPKEGSIAHNNPAGILQAPWVSAEQVEGARQWISFLREEAQQRAFMEEGFRPATRLPLADPISAAYGLNPAGPTTVFPPVKATVARSMVQAWDDVKKPGIVTFLVDVSGSMSGAKLEQAKHGMVRALDSLSPTNQVGFLTFSDGVRARVPAAPITNNRFTIAEQVQKMQATGNTALYDALSEALLMTDEAPGDPNAIRGVVVLTDGQATGGQKALPDLVQLMSRNERPVAQFTGFSGANATEDAGGRIEKRDVLGTGMRLSLHHPVHVFFVGLGADADLDIGRILAEATASAYEGATEKDLAAVLEKFGKYF